MRKIAFRLPLVTLALSLAAFAQSGPVKLSSPDGRLAIEFRTSADGQLSYSVSHGGEAVIAPSNMGLQFGGGAPLGGRVSIISNTMGGADETYEVIHGKSNPVRNRYRSVRVELAESGAGGRRMSVEARAYDEGVAFRYHVPAQAAIPDPLGFRLAGERTEFRFAVDSIAYPIYLQNYFTSYEDEYHREAISGIAADHLIGLPLLVEYPKVGWAAVTEAHIEEYPGTYLRKAGPALVTGLSSAGGPKVEHALPHKSPWRVIMVAPEIGRLVESNIVINLNPAPEGDFSWVKPGKSLWDWWAGKYTTEDGWQVGMDTRTFRYMIDFAAESGFDYVLVDDGWSPRQNILQANPGIDIPEIVRYGKSKGVGVWIWLHWTGVDRHMQEAFPLYEKWGVVGLKIDFMDRDDQWMVNWYHRVTALAAKHKLMVDYHGAYKPDGLRRTYPNLMTREGALGLEYTKWSRRAGPEHNMHLPFTRMLAGPLDYTPGGFGNVTRAEFVPRFDEPVVLGTRAHQLALFAIFESPFLCAPDTVERYRNAPAFQFIKDVPATWDETRVLDAAVGDFIVIARRKGEEWFIGAATDWTPRELEIPLRFLGGGTYTAQIYADAAGSKQDPTKVEISKQEVNSSSTLKAAMVPGGGYAVRLAK